MSSSADFTSKISVRPFSSDTDEEKEDLKKEAELYRDRLELQWDGLKANATEYGKQALIIGGVIATTYVVMNAILPGSKKDKKKKEEEPSVPRNHKQSAFQIGPAVQSLAWTLAVSWARQKLKNYIADDREPDENRES
ncbi:hypothetical protein DYBT9275_00112 [Dyadobacter sp. CECT 9275]|uniref:Uncharacterized protein n=1 Tax=Dyadobacter helix TaxID=2822344 RepID=A0A916J7C3_9BACT|nr:hypothetical protein [Dyadobacter sp. CECT 9275]CAG4988567.1 hypothetical protein DYBT9275_00112 [Dyadobacter sp. CECT 9275]